MTKGRKTETVLKPYTQDCYTQRQHASAVRKTIRLQIPRDLMRISPTQSLKENTSIFGEASTFEQPAIPM